MSPGKHQVLTTWCQGRVTGGYLQARNDERQSTVIGTFTVRRKKVSLPLARG